MEAKTERMVKALLEQEDVRELKLTRQDNLNQPTLSERERKAVTALRAMIDAYREGVADKDEPSMVRDALAALAMFETPKVEV